MKLLDVSISSLTTSRSLVDVRDKVDHGLVPALRADNLLGYGSEILPRISVVNLGGHGTLFLRVGPLSGIHHVLSCCLVHLRSCLSFIELLQEYLLLIVQRMGMKYNLLGVHLISALRCH